MERLPPFINPELETMPDHQVRMAQKGPLGIITLARPEAINALNSEMIKSITEALDRWNSDPAIAAILFEGEGPKGFCAGGDVRAVRENVLRGDWQTADGFFETEYAMNLKIATSFKPIIALTHGVIMGGGIGLAGHAALRVTTASSRFAMPEAAIGFVADVGSDAPLLRANEHRALLFLMTGEAVGAPDAFLLGLTDLVLNDGDFATARETILNWAEGRAELLALRHALAPLAAPAGEAQFCALADRQKPALGFAGLDQILYALNQRAADDEALAERVAILKKRSRSSLAIIVAKHRAAREDPRITAILANDLAAARFMIRRPDFAEGVRAVLVDKDRNPAFNDHEPTVWELSNLFGGVGH